MEDLVFTGFGLLIESVNISNGDRGTHVTNRITLSTNFRKRGDHWFTRLWRRGTAYRFLRREFLFVTGLAFRATLRRTDRRCFKLAF